ncbi:MAG: TonB-dependent receptor plug domain-containing protein [Siphonobacter sp.]
MGRFLFTPETGKTYTAVINSNNTKSLKVALPASKPGGQVLMVDNFINKDFVRVLVFNNKPTSGDLILFAQMRGEVVWVAKASASKQAFAVNIPRDKFSSSGIAQLTLFSALGEPLAERIFFIYKKENQLNVELKSEKSKYITQEKVDIEITVKDSEGRPVSGDFSLVATDQGQVVREPNAESLISYLEMSSDLKGFIEQPGYYFNVNNPNALLYLDYLMLTQGWRRFNWKTVLNNQLIHPVFKIENGLSIAGQIRRPSGKKIENKEVKVTLMIDQGQKDSILRWINTDDEGNFSFNDLFYPDSVKVLLQAVSGKMDKNFSIVLQKSESPHVSIIRTPYNPVQINSAEFIAYLKNAAELDKFKTEQARILEEITVRGEKEGPEFKKLYDKPDSRIKFDQQNSSGAMTIFQVLQGRVPGLIISGGANEYTVQMRGPLRLSGTLEPSFLLNGTPVNKEMVMSIDPSNVDYVDVLKGASSAIYGSRGSAGVIAIVTKKGYVGSASSAAAGMFTQYFKGYAIEKEFYSPQQDELPVKSADYRTTLMWLPKIHTDQAGHARISFRTNHSPVYVCVEGVAGNGKVGTASTIITVE